MSDQAELVPADLLKVIPPSTSEQGPRFTDLRASAAVFYADMMKVVPPGPHRENARKQLRNCLVSCVLGVSMAGLVGPTRAKVSDDDGR